MNTDNYTKQTDYSQVLNTQPQQNFSQVFPQEYPTQQYIKNVPKVPGRAASITSLILGIVACLLFIVTSFLGG